MIICSSGYGLFIASVFKPYGATFEPNYLALIGSIGAVINGVCWMFWATLQDKVGFKLVYIIICAAQALVIFLLPTVHTSKSLYLIWIVLSYFFYGGHYSIFPTVSAKIYGPETGAWVYPILFSGFALSTIIGVILAKVIIPAIQDKDNPTAAYNPIFYT